MPPARKPWHRDCCDAIEKECISSDTLVIPSLRSIGNPNQGNRYFFPADPCSGRLCHQRAGRRGGRSSRRQRSSVWLTSSRGWTLLNAGRSAKRASWRRGGKSWRRHRRKPSSPVSRLAAPQAAPRATSRARRCSGWKGVGFEPGTSRLTDASRLLLDQLADRLRAENAAYFLEVQSGSRGGGQRPSAPPAWTTVRRYLHEDHGLPLHSARRGRGDAGSGATLLEVSDRDAMAADRTASAPTGR